MHFNMCIQVIQFLLTQPYQVASSLCIGHEYVSVRKQYSQSLSTYN